MNDDGRSTFVASARDRERRNDIVDSNNVPGLSDHSGESAPALRYRCPGRIHLASTINY